MKVKIYKQGRYTKKDVDKLKRRNKDIRVIDQIELWMSELYKINNPQEIEDRFLNDKISKYIKQEYKKVRDRDVYGNWVLYPEFHNERQILLHTLVEKDYYHVITNRNREIISKKGSQKLRRSTISIIGQSIGGNVALLLAHMGIGKLKLADFDTIDPSNLNRMIFADVRDVGRSKTDTISQKLLLINPYIKLKLYPKGVDNRNISEFISNSSVIIEQCDSFKMKIIIRKQAKKLKIPVVMLTSLGRWLLVDIERYDSDPETKLFNGYVSKTLIEDINKDKVSMESMKKFARDLVGKQNIDQLALKSLPLIGSKGGLVGRPQIMPTVAVNAGLTTLIITSILQCFSQGENLKSTRKLIKLDEIIVQ